MKSFLRSLHCLHRLLSGRSPLRLFRIRRDRQGLLWISLVLATWLLTTQLHTVTAQAQDGSDSSRLIDSGEVADPVYDTWDESGMGDPADFIDRETACTDDPALMQLALGDLQSNVLQMADWIENPQTPVSSLLHSLGPTVVAQFQASPSPEIHERARSAKVPILMYHDILAEKEVFFDVTPEEFEDHLKLIQENGLTPISMDQLFNHLRTGLPLPEKPVMLTFDDGYLGHYTYVFPLLKQYGYPGLFSIYTYKVGRDHGRPGVDWAQVQEMANDPLMTIASHGVMHPPDLRVLDDQELYREVVESKQELEERLGIPIRYFVYPEGNYDERVVDAVIDAGYLAALTMNDLENRMAGDSNDLFSIDRIGQSQTETVIAEAWGGSPVRPWGSSFDFSAPIERMDAVVDNIPVTLISGGQPVTIHADTRYQVKDIVANTAIEAAVDGTFFSLEFLDSNRMIGPVMGQNTGEFIPGDRNDVPFLRGRPLVMISPTEVRFIPFDPERHNALQGVQAEMPAVTDTFVAAAWLVRDGQPQSAESFGSLFDFDAARHRAFWGINTQGQPVVGVTHYFVDSIHLGEILAGLGLQDVVMLDSGASTALVYQGDSLVGYEPRPVPHVVGLVPTGQATASAASVASGRRICPPAS
jgi:biofilm PGA synthesis lipoprotein PgaB